MSNPVFDKFTVQSPLRELNQISAAITGIPAPLDARWDQDPFARLRAVENATSDTAVFNQWTVLDPQRRLNTLAAQNLSYVPLAIKLRKNPYAYTLPAGPAGVPAP